MTEPPYFRNDILTHIRDNFIYYFGYDDFYVYALAVAAVLLVNALLAARLGKTSARLLPDMKNYSFAALKPADISAALLLALSCGLYVANIFSLDLTIFNNYDQMNAANINDMRYGQAPVFNALRFNPAAGIDHNVIYGISHNYTIIAWWNVLKQFLALWLLYRFFSFIPVGRRLVMLAVINFLPPVFWVNGIVYSEQNTLIFVVLSLFALKNYDIGKKFCSLFAFVLWMNLAIYTKETNILFYLGILVFLLLQNIAAGRLTPKSFLSPLATIRTMPVEYMLLWSMFLFAVGYFLLSDLFVGGAYLRHHHRSVGELLKINALELTLTTAAVFAFGAKIGCRKNERTNLFAEGLLCGGAIIAVIVVFKLQIACFPDWYKTWYMYLPAVFCTAYIFGNIRSRAISALIFIPVVCWSASVNYDIWQKEEGVARRMMAEFITERKNLQATFYMSEEAAGDLWKLECFASALKYVGGNIRLATDMPLSAAKKQILGNGNYCEIIERPPAAGDYVIVRKDTAEAEKRCDGRPVYENKVYKICRVGSADKEDNVYISGLAVDKPDGL